MGAEQDFIVLVEGIRKERDGWLSSTNFPFGDSDGGTAWKYGVFKGKPATAIIQKGIGARDYGVEGFILPGKIEQKEVEYGSHRRNEIWSKSVWIDSEDDPNYELANDLMNEDDPVKVWKALKGPKI